MVLYLIYFFENRFTSPALLTNNGSLWLSILMKECLTFYHQSMGQTEQWKSYTQLYTISDFSSFKHFPDFCCLISGISNYDTLMFLNSKQSKFWLSKFLRLQSNLIFVHSYCSVTKAIVVKMLIGLTQESLLLASWKHSMEPTLKHSNLWVAIFNDILMENVSALIWFNWNLYIFLINRLTFKD